MYCFLAFVSVCLYVYVVALCLAMCSWVDVEQPEEPQYQYPEQPSSEHFEQQQEQYEEGKYNMNTTYHLITFSYCILILYAYKDFPSHFISFIYILWVAFWLVMLGAAL